MTRDDDDDLTADDRRLLALWPAPVPPADFEARLTTRLQAERAPLAAGSGRAAARGTRELAFAALAVVLVGGMLTARLLAPGAASGPAAGSFRTAPADGGPAAEVSPVGDRVRS